MNGFSYMKYKYWLLESMCQAYTYHHNSSEKNRYTK